MRAWNILLLGILWVLCMIPLVVHADDLADLKSGFEKELAALSSGDLETVMGNQHEQVLVLNPASPDPIDGKVARRKDYKQLLESMETFTVTPEDPQFWVVGNTGLVWGTYTIGLHPKGGEATTFRIRFSRTYIKENGLW